MNPDSIEKLASEIVSQTFLGSWLFYFILISISAIASAATSFITSYFSTRGVNLANKADIAKIKETLKDQTELTEGIKTELAHVSARKHALEQLKREKLEHYLLSVIQGADHLSDDAKHRFFGSPTPSSGRHTDIASMLQRLYFPELAQEHAAYLRVVAKFKEWIGVGMALQLEQFKKGIDKPSPPDSHLNQYGGLLEEMNIALLAIEQASKKVAEELNGG